MLPNKTEYHYFDCNNDLKTNLIFSANEICLAKSIPILIMHRELDLGLTKWKVFFVENG